MWGLAALLALSVGGCSSDSRAFNFAKQSCEHVQTAIGYYEQETPSLSAAQNASLDLQAQTQLGKALPLAAHAAENAGGWQGLMTTLQESNRVDIKYLIPALSQQCTMTLGHQVGPATSSTTSSSLTGAGGAPPS